MQTQARRTARHTRGTPARLPPRPRVPDALYRRLFEQAQGRCAALWCPCRDLEVHHIDGDPTNNRESNLLLLCRKHHAMTAGARPKLDRHICVQLKRAIIRLSDYPLQDKGQVAEVWRQLCSKAGSSARTRERFKSVIKGLLAGIQGFAVHPAERADGTHELDFVVQNESSNPSLKRLGAEIAVSCNPRNRQRVGASGVRAFLGAMTLNGWRTGLVFSLSGFTANAEEAAARASQNGRLIVLVRPDEIEEVIESRNRTEDILLRAAARTLLAGR